LNHANSKFLLIKRFLRIITIIYFAWIFLRSIGQIYMIWNVILAWVPLEIASLMGYFDSKQKGKSRVKPVIIVLGLLWLLFYPNSPYIVTDFIHLSTNEFHLINPNYEPYANEARILFNDNITIWLEFVTIGIGVWIGYTVGFLSLYSIQQSLRKKHNHMMSWIFVSMIHLLTGFAIYLGRFNRWNSWDIMFSPAKIIAILQSSMSLKALQFTLLFGIFSFVLYAIDYLLVQIGPLSDKAKKQ